NEQQFHELVSHQFRTTDLYSQSIQSAGLWSTRSFIAARTWWKRIRGYWRLYRFLCPSLQDKQFPQHCSKPIGVVLHDDGIMLYFLDPFRVRKRSRWSLERPSIVLAVATR